MGPAKPNGGGTCDIGWTEANEWLEYDLNIDEAGNHSVYFSVGAGQNNRSLRVLLDGAAVGTVEVPNIGYSAFTEVKLSPVAFNAGASTLRVEFSGAGINLDYIRIGDVEPLADADPDEILVPPLVHEPADPGPQDERRDG